MNIGKYGLGILVKAKQGLFAVGAEDLYVSRALLLNVEYNSNELVRLQTFVSSESRVLFIGAHIGSLLILIAQRCKKVIAFEPNPFSYELLSINLILNKVTNCQAFNLAASDKSEKLDFLLNMSNSGGSKRIPLIKAPMYYCDNPETITIDAVPLDSHIKEREFDLVVMDIEGSEYFALKGMQEILNNARVLQVEFLPHHLKNVSGVTVKDFVALIEPHFAILYIPSQKLTVHKQNFIKVLTEMYERNIGDEGIIFHKNEEAMRKAIIYLEQGKEEESFEQFQKVLKTDPINQDAHLGIAVFARQNGDSVLALRHLKRLLELNPDHAGTYNLYGMISFESGNLENAKKLFITAIEKDPTLIEAQWNLGEVLFALEDYETGVQTFMAILENHPNDVPTLLNVSHLYLEVGKNGEAIAYLEKANRLEPDNGEVLDMLKIVTEREESERSNPQPEMQDDKRETAEDSRLTHASSLLIEGEIEAAKVLYAEVLSEDSQSEEALFGLALCARQQQDNESALRHLNRLIKINPNCADAYNQSGLISFETGDFVSAKTMFIAAIEKDPKFIEAQRNYGEVLLALEDYENGVKTFMSILENHPDDVPSLLRMRKF